MSRQASDLFVVDNSDADWKVRSYLKGRCELSKAIDIATGYFEIGVMLTLDEKWQSIVRVCWSCSQLRQGSFRKAA